ncbi:MAG: cell division protein FtsZ [Bacteroidaceae bacterium]|nr:cell division protein FtsZ [Bacteroidaceae bacterium]
MNNDSLNDIPLEFNFPKDKTENIIKVIGVGGGGGNAVTNMYKQGICNVAFAVCNTDSQALAKCEVPVRIQLGESGLGTGGNPDKGKQDAEEDIARIEKLFDDDTKMVFITAGMGGGTGTGAAPVVARVAREHGILTIGIVTIPFRFEGKVRIKKALKGVNEMKKNVDAILVINNERLIDLYGNEMMDAESALNKADEILTISTKSIAEIITVRGIINRDFQDVQTVMKKGGMSLISVGEASGEHRIQKAFMKALESPLLSNMYVEKAQKLLYIIYSCEEKPVGMNELGEINNLMEEFAEDMEMLWGLYRDNTLGDKVKVAIIASGLEENASSNLPSQIEDEEFIRQMESYYGVKRNDITPQETSTEEKDKEEEEEIATTLDESVPKKHVKKSFLEKLKETLNNLCDQLTEED